MGKSEAEFNFARHNTKRDNYGFIRGGSCNLAARMNSLEAPRKTAAGGAGGRKEVGELQPRLYRVGIMPTGRGV
jgi:hypothetical protein